MPPSAFLRAPYPGAAVIPLAPILRALTCGHMTLVPKGSPCAPAPRGFWLLCCSFPSVAKQWMAALLHDCDRERQGVDLMGRDSLLLGRVLVTMVGAQATPLLPPCHMLLITGRGCSAQLRTTQLGAQTCPSAPASWRCFSSRPCHTCCACALALANHGVPPGSRHTRPSICMHHRLLDCHGRWPGECVQCSRPSKHNSPMSGNAERAVVVGLFAFPACWSVSFYILLHCKLQLNGPSPHQMRFAYAPLDHF